MLARRIAPVRGAPFAFNCIVIRNWTITLSMACQVLWDDNPAESVGQANSFRKSEPMPRMRHALSITDIRSVRFRDFKSFH